MYVCEYIYIYIYFYIYDILLAVYRGKYFCFIYFLELYELKCVLHVLLKFGQGIPSTLSFLYFWGMFALFCTFV